MHYKFRAIKRSEPHRWVYGSLITPQGQSGPVFIEIGKPGSLDVSRYEVIPETVGMFTGLHDNYNTEMYGGDLLAFMDRGEKKKKPIVWHGYGFGIQDGLGGYCLPNGRTIQGTIHDHFLTSKPTTIQ